MPLPPMDFEMSYLRQPVSGGWNSRMNCVLTSVADCRISMSEAQAQPARASGVIPQHGVFVVGKTLAGVGLGYTQAQVKAHWGAGYTVCTAKPQCSPTGSVWLFVPRVGEPLGVGVRFRNGK